MLCLIALRAHAYSTNDTLFASGVDACIEERYSDAITLLRQSQYSRVDIRTIPLSDFYLAKAYFKIGNFDSAKYFAHLILRNSYSTQTVAILEMDHTPLFKNYAADILCNYYMAHHKYHSALHYLHLCTKVYPHHSFCNIDVTENIIYTASQYAHIYKMLGKKRRAEKKLFSVMFFDFELPITYVSDSLKQLLLYDKQKNKIKTNLRKSATQLYTKKVNSGSKDKTIIYYIRFMGNKIFMPYSAKDGIWDLATGNTTRTEPDIIAHIKQTPIYKMVQSL